VDDYFVHLWWANIQVAADFASLVAALPLVFLLLWSLLLIFSASWYPSQEL